MSTRNNHWYNLNEQRNYPLDDAASAVSDEGHRLPNSLIQDLRIQWPDSLGKYAFLSAVSVTKHLVTLMIEAVDHPEINDGSSVLIAGISLPRRDLEEGRTYAMETFHDNVGGFITIGSDEGAPWRGIFSTPAQSRLTPRAARATKSPPIPSLGVKGAAKALTGIVRLSAVPPLVLEKQPMSVQSQHDWQENVVVIRLKEDPGTLAAGGLTESVFTQFAGPCGKRVGARTCGDPQPIEAVNGVQPDCDGVLTLEFLGCAVVGRNINDCGVVVDCGLGLSSSCAPLFLPALEDGKLPSEIDPFQTPVPEPGPENSQSVSYHFSRLTFPSTDWDNPRCLKFFANADDVGTRIDELVAPPVITYGFPNSQWVFSDEVSPADSKTSCCDTVTPPTLSPYNYHLLPTPEDYCDQLYGNTSELLVSLGTTVPEAISEASGFLANTVEAPTDFYTWVTEMKIASGPYGAKHRAGMLAYCPGLPPRMTGISLLLDTDNKTIGFYLYDGALASPLKVVDVPGLRVDDWYRLYLRARPVSTQRPNERILMASVQGVTDPSVVTHLDLTLEEPPSILQEYDWDGDVYMFADRSYALYSFVYGVGYDDFYDYWDPSQPPPD